MKSICERNNHIKKIHCSFEPKKHRKISNFTGNNISNESGWKNSRRNLILHQSNLAYWNYRPEYSSKSEISLIIRNNYKTRNCDCLCRKKKINRSDRTIFHNDHFYHVSPYIENNVFGFNQYELDDFDSAAPIPPIPTQHKSVSDGERKQTFNVAVQTGRFTGQIDGTMQTERISMRDQHSQTFIFTSNRVSVMELKYGHAGKNLKDQIKNNDGKVEKAKTMPKMKVVGCPATNIEYNDQDVKIVKDESMNTNMEDACSVQIKPCLSARSLPLFHNKTREPWKSKSALNFDGHTKHFSNYDQRKKTSRFRCSLPPTNNNIWSMNDHNQYHTMVVRNQIGDFVQKTLNKTFQTVQPNTHTYNQNVETLNLHVKRAKSGLVLTWRAPSQPSISTKAPQIHTECTSSDETMSNTSTSSTISRPCYKRRKLLDTNCNLVSYHDLFSFLDRILNNSEHISTENDNAFMNLLDQVFSNNFDKDHKTSSTLMDKTYSPFLTVSSIINEQDCTPSIRPKLTPVKKLKKINTLKTEHISMTTDGNHSSPSILSANKNTLFIKQDRHHDDMIHVKHSDSELECSPPKLKCKAASYNDYLRVGHIYNKVRGRPCNLHISKSEENWLSHRKKSLLTGLTKQNVRKSLSESNLLLLKGNTKWHDNILEEIGLLDYDDKVFRLKGEHFVQIGDSSQNGRNSPREESTVLQSNRKSNLTSIISFEKQSAQNIIMDSRKINACNPNEFYFTTFSSEKSSTVGAVWNSQRGPKRKTLNNNINVDCHKPFVQQQLTEDESLESDIKIKIPETNGNVYLKKNYSFTINIPEETSFSPLQKLNRISKKKGSSSITSNLSSQSSLHTNLFAISSSEESDTNTSLPTNGPTPKKKTRCTSNKCIKELFEQLENIVGKDDC